MKLKAVCLRDFFMEDYVESNLFDKMNSSFCMRLPLEDMDEQYKFGLRILDMVDSKKRAAIFFYRMDGSLFYVWKDEENDGLGGMDDELLGFVRETFDGNLDEPPLDLFGILVEVQPGIYSVVDK